MSQLLTRVVAPVSRALFEEDQLIMAGLDHHHSFIVRPPARPCPAQPSNRMSFPAAACPPLSA